MQGGCGLQVRRIKGRGYVYFRHYNGPKRSRQTVLYCGPAGLPKTRERALRLLLEHEERTRHALEERIARYRRALERFGSR